MSNHNQRYTNSKGTVFRKDTFQQKILDEEEEEYSDSFEEDDDQEESAERANGTSPRQAWAQKTNKAPSEDSEGEEDEYNEKPTHSNLNGKALKKAPSSLSLRSISNKSSSLSQSADSARALDAFASRKKRSNSMDSIERLKKDADLLSPRPATEREMNIQQALKEYLSK